MKRLRRSPQRVAFCDQGYLNVEITDTTTGEWCDEASLERAARAEGH